MTFLNDIRNLPSGSVRSGSETSLFKLPVLSELVELITLQFRLLKFSASKPFLKRHCVSEFKTSIYKNDVWSTVKTDSNKGHLHRTSGDLKGGRRFAM